MSKVSFTGDWKLLFKPEKYAGYINDHTIYKDITGKWKLLGTSSKGEYKFNKERQFILGETASLNKEMVEVGNFFTNEPHKGIKIAPNVYFDVKTKTYHLFFAPMFIYHYISTDGNSWQRVDDAVRSFWPALRDPFVLKVDGCYFMYLTDYGNRISVYKSNDLFKWKKLKRSALILDSEIPRSFNSSCESPCVFKKGKNFFLTTTITPSPQGRRFNYCHTPVFISEDPENFGVYSTNPKKCLNRIGDLETHAPEFVEDDNKMYLTSCGWKNFPKPIGVDGEGVYIREIEII